MNMETCYYDNTELVSVRHGFEEICSVIVIDSLSE